MSKPDTASITTRRALALGAGAFASIGLTAGAAAAVADAAIPALTVTERRGAEALQPDAELIRLCGAFDELERQRLELFAKETPAQQKRLEDLADQQDLLLDDICELPPTTHEGAVALASTLALWDCELLKDRSPSWNDRMIVALVRGLLGRAPA
jgi:hypothetical protein